jgi:zinc protease
MQEKLGAWQGGNVEKIAFPVLSKPSVEHINYPINRDQVVLRFAGLSVNRKDSDYDKLLLYDQIFTGGALSSMASRLFQLREQSGLFYTIGGSMIAGADEQPGMILVQTIVSLDRLQEAEKAIKECIVNTADTIQPHEFIEAKNAIINAQIDNFASNYNIANVFLFLDRYGFAQDFFDTRAQKLGDISLDEIKQAAKKVLQNQLLTLRVGRINDLAADQKTDTSQELQ